MKICHVCNYHLADDGRVFHRECVELARAGYEVHLIALGKGNAPYEDQGVVIHPLPECETRRERYGRRSWIAERAAALQPDLFHVHEPDLLGSVLAQAGTRPVVYDVHESYLDMLTDRDWIPRAVRPFVRIAWDVYERNLVRRCAGVIAVTEPIARRYARLHGKVSVVANYPDWDSAADPPFGQANGTTCVVAGSLTPSRGLPQIFRALALLKQRGLHVELALAGWGWSDDYLASLWEEAKRLGVYAQVHYHGPLSKREALAFQQKASIGLVTYLPSGNTRVGLPNKLVECMALGLPVVCSDFPVYREVAGLRGAGILVDPTRPEQIADAVESLILHPDLAREMGKAGRRAVREKYNWGVERLKLLTLYQDLLGVPGRDRCRSYGMMETKPA